MLRIAVCIIGVSALVGCAAAVEPVPDNIDHAQVAAIERASRRAGVQVIWLRMPTKPVPPASGS
jgi:hypothetical protein